ncbi:MAG: ABC transporter ATP-binding protein [Candidatus Nezhaarchaeota archaeon]|nr:ABC transporter ATP-binding protein [Candidatus Nezhaarchaeota archaeon]MCX8141246.1 ABC transporter ATP-binding protein [Candidatus Nezhaarchaeota archaeon]MDW8049512.1 ABC transporter ATP-binding protein [Nitrososphaerota archaeon]
MNDDVVVVENVYKCYRTGEVVTWALRGVNLRVKRGDIIAIMGPSGSGKTTLLNIIGSLDRPTKGKVYIDGVDTATLSDRELAMFRNYKVGFVFQQFNLVGRLTVLENIELPLIARGLSRNVRQKIVLDALHKVGGDESWLIKRPTQLSGGQQQRVAIARAIVTSPSIILADEPTGNLDMTSAKVVMNTFLELNRMGQTIIIVTHNPEVANCTNRIYVIRDGVIVDVKEPDRGKSIVKM